MMVLHTYELDGLNSDSTNYHRRVHEISSPVGDTFEKKNTSGRSNALWLMAIGLSKFGNMTNEAAL